MVAAKPKHTRFTYDKAFQLKLLKTLYQDADFTCSTGIHLSASHFERKHHRWLAHEILTYAAKHGHGIGRDALKIQLAHARKRDPRRWDDDTVDAVEATIERLDSKVKDRSFVKEELFRFIKNQTTREAILESLDHLDVQDFDAIDRAFNRVLAVQESFSGGLGTFFVRDVVDRIKKRAQVVRNGISTGTRLDEYMDPGGLPPKALGCIIAPSGMGKSHCLVHIGKSAILESNARVLHITLELAEEFIAQRYDAAFSNIAINRLRDKPKTLRKRIKHFGQQFGEFLVIKHFPMASLTATALLAFVRKLERLAFYPTVIIVDYADLMLPSIATREKNLYDDAGTIYQELRRVGHETNTAMWTASQTNKEALNREHYDWNMIADSSKKAHISDFIACFMQTPREKKQKRARFGLLKNRFGPDKFDIPIHPDWTRSIIRS